MKILRDYTLKEALKPFLLSLSVFIFILLLGNLLHSVDKIISKGSSLIDVLKLFSCWIPYLLRYALPMSLLTAILLSFGRLSSDNEIMAMRASGFSLYRVILPMVAIGLIISLFAVILNDRIIPRAHYASRKILAKIVATNPTGVIEEGTFIRFKNNIIFVNEIKNKKLYGIKIFQTQQGKNPRITVAKEGRIMPSENKDIIKLKLIDGSLDEPKPNKPSEFYQLKFKTYYISLNLREGQTGSVQKKAGDMTISEAKKEIKRLKKYNINPINLIVEINKRIVLSFANLAFILIGLPLAIKTKKSSKSAGFGISLVVIVIYYVMLAGSSALAVKGIFPPAFGIWLPNIIIMGIGLILLYRIIER